MQLRNGAGQAYYRRSALGALLLTIGSAPLAAAVYQCQGADASTVYSDKPCGSDAKLIIVRPQAPLSSTPANAAHSSPSVLSRGKPIGQDLVPTPTAKPDQDSLQCQGRQYLAWYKAQQPKPTREQSDAMMRQIIARCGAYAMSVSAPEPAAANVHVQQVEVSAPQVTGGGAGMMSAPRTSGGIPEVSRSRQATEAARWDGYYSCRTKAFQEWSESLGHAADSQELALARSQIDTTCRERLSLPAGPAAVVVD
jgi:hypothetical protein